MGNRLEGKVAIVSGAARGQGAAEARLFVSLGARVVLGDVLDAEGEEVAAELGGRATYQHLDVTEADQWAAVVEAAESFGPLNVLVNNAGVYRYKKLVEEDADEVRRLFDVNVIGPMLGMQAVAEPMQAAGGGSIVNISSIAGLTGNRGVVAYGSSKWALRGMTKIAALELGRLGIRVNSVHPGVIDTPMVPDVLREGDFVQKLPIDRVGTPLDVAELVAYLVSDESSYQTGGEYVVDGGQMAGITPLS